MTDGPYRTSGDDGALERRTGIASAAQLERAVLRRLVGWVAMCAAIVGLGAAVGLGALALVIPLAIAGTVEIAIAARHRRRLLAAHAALPFPVRHRPSAAYEGLGGNFAVRIAVEFAAMPEGPALERIARDAQLAAAIEPDALVLTCERGRLGLRELVRLLDEWGRATHAQHPIESVEVQWVTWDTNRQPGPTSR